VSSGRASDDAADGLRRALDRYADGVHEVGAPSAALDADMPAGLVAVYRAMDGVDLFQGDLVLRRRAEWRRDGQRVEVGALGEDGLWIDLASGSVWRLEADTAEWLEEGSTLERWLWGWLEAQSLLYDREGEFVDGVLGPDGDLLRETAIERERRILRRDPKAVGPRWRLARELIRAGETGEARDQLEEVVAARPGFGWAWFDLARLSEKLGEIDNAREEALAAAEADPAYEHAAFFLAAAARLAALAGDDAARAQLAARALAADPDLARRQLDGARDNLAAEDRSAAREMVAVALALEPTNLAALDLARQLS
jgi:tetratricopeptide (TPR) repeat protein